MKNNRPRKLALSRETLSAMQLGTVAAAATTLTAVEGCWTMSCPTEGRVSCAYSCRIGFCPGTFQCISVQNCQPF